MKSVRRTVCEVYPLVGIITALLSILSYLMTLFISSRSRPPSLIYREPAFPLWGSTWRQWIYLQYSDSSGWGLPSEKLSQAQIALQFWHPYDFIMILWWGLQARPFSVSYITTDERVSSGFWLYNYLFWIPLQCFKPSISILIIRNVPRIENAVWILTF